MNHKTNKMREDTLKYLAMRLGSLTQFYQGLNFYQDVIADIEKHLAIAKKRHEGFKQQVNDQEYLKTIDYYEQKALSENEQNYRASVAELSGAIQHMLARKFTRNINYGLFYLEELRLNLKDLLSGYYPLTETNKNVQVKDVMDGKKFKKASYLTKLNMLLVAMTTFRDDIRDSEDAFPTPQTDFHKASLIKLSGKMEIILQEEIEDIEANGMPEPYEFELPNIVKPEEPEGPESDVENIDNQETEDKSKVDKPN